jgi:ATP-binding cassette, subfamily B, bacterial PglK
MKAAIQYLREILFLMEEDRKIFPWLILLFIFSSLLDVLGLGIIGPYLAAVLNPETILQSTISDYLITIGFSSSANDLLIFIGWALIIIFLFKTVVSIYIKKSIVRFSWNRHAILQRRLMENYQNISYLDYLQRNSSDYLQTINVLVSIYAHSVMEIILQMISQIMIAVVIISYLTLMNTNMIFIFGFIGLLLFSFDYLLNKNLKYYSKSANDAEKMMIQGISEGIEGLKEMRVLGKKDYFINKVGEGSNKFTQNKIKSNVIKTLPPYLSEFIFVTFFILSILILMELGYDLNPLIPAFGVVGLAFMRLKPAVNFIAEGITRLRYGRYATNKIYLDLLKKNKQPSISNIETQNKNEFARFSTLSLDKVTFKYPNVDKRVLNNITMTISNNESIGLIGPSGSGKTTLVDTLLGLLEPQSGTILYNGKPIRDCLLIWQQQIAYLPQEIFLIDDTLECNVALGIHKTKINIQKVEMALQKARLRELVDELPLGIKTMLGERGVRLSGGQRQRVALARAFYHGRNILVMDEATSSLDNETEREIVEEIKHLKGRKTIIVVAHRLTTVQHCDRIYRLEEGRIVDTGSFRQVVKNS